MAGGTTERIMQRFHSRCGRSITLWDGNRSAQRQMRNFSHALVFSAEPLIDDVLFEVVIEKKVCVCNKQYVIICCIDGLFVHCRITRGEAALKLALLQSRPMIWN